MIAECRGWVGRLCPYQDVVSFNRRVRVDEAQVAPVGKPAPAARVRPAARAAPKRRLVDLTVAQADQVVRLGLVASVGPVGRAVAADRWIPKRCWHARACQSSKRRR